VKCSACQKDVPPGRFCLQCGAALSTAPRFGDYEVDGVIGEGGMGRVFKAKQPRLKRVVCIKTLLPQFASDEAVVTRFEREATTTAALKHPNIVSIIDVERGDDGVPFIVMEYVEGRSLRQLLRDEAPLSPARAVALVDQVLAGLAEAHAHGIVHRDLKPSNVLVEALKDGTELCKVLDFGIARTIGGDSTDPQLTRTGMMLGTPGYMAPEQISSSDFDHRVDLYAAGVILYELLTGGRMVRAPSETELLKKTLLEDPPAPSSRTSTNVPAALDATVLKAVARDPKTRFSSAGEFREVLGRSLGSSVSVFTNPALQVQLDTTSLAQAATDTASNDVTNPRALLTAVLGTSEGWELSRMLDVFERSLQELLSSEQTGLIAVLLRTLQDAAKTQAASESFKAVVALFRQAFLGHLSSVLGWMEQAPHAQVARWMVKVIGRDGTMPLLEALQKGEAHERGAVVEALRLVEPKVTELVERVRTLPVAVMKTMVAEVSRWPEADAGAFVTAALNSGSAPHRHAALEGLTEAQAFRATAIIRIRLHDPHPAVRAEALRWVFRLDDEGAVPELMKALERPTISASERKQVYRTLGHLGGTATPALLRALMKEPDESALAELVSLLSRSGDQGAVAAVKRIAEDPKTPKPLKQLCVEGLKSAMVPSPSAPRR
jgi:serine/threonine protein kinase